MAIACQCDRCGKFYGYDPEKIYKGRYRIVLNNRNDPSMRYRDDDGYRVDICDDCIKDFELFMNKNKENKDGQTDCNDCEPC